MKNLAQRMHMDEAFHLRLDRRGFETIRYNVRRINRLWTETPLGHKGFVSIANYDDGAIVTRRPKHIHNFRPKREYINKFKGG